MNAGLRARAFILFLPIIPLIHRPRRVCESLSQKRVKEFFFGSHGIQSGNSRGYGNTLRRRAYLSQSSLSLCSCAPSSRFRRQFSLDVIRHPRSDGIMMKQAPSSIVGHHSVTIFHSYKLISPVNYIIGIIFPEESA